MERLLSPYRVLDLTDNNGWSCGRILGDLGADVIKVEPPGGDPGRRDGPFFHDERDPEKSLHWFAYNTNKRGITLNLKSARGQELFRRLAKKSDFIIRSTEDDFSFEKLRELNPRLIVTTITPFGTTGPYAKYRGSDLIAMAMSGFMYLVGEPGKPPLRITLPQAAMWTGMYAAAGTLIAHYHRETTGRGQHVDVSMQASMLWALANAPAFWSVNRENLKRAGNKIVGRSITGATMRAIYECKDGHINFILYGGEAGKRSNEAMVEWMAETDAAPDWLKQKDWESFSVQMTTQEEIDQIEKPFIEFLKTLTKSEFANETARRGIMGYPVANARDIRDDSQLEAREFWQNVEHPELGAAITYAGAFAKFSESEIKIRRRAPMIAEHNEEIYAGELGLDMDALKRDGVI